MAPRERTYFTTTTILGKSYMNQVMIQDMDRILEVDFAQAPPSKETFAKPHLDEVVLP